MVSIPSLWLPILLSAVFVFFASFLVHMLLGYHARDLRKVPQEDAVMAALRPFDLAPGDYMMPCAQGMQAMRSPEFRDKRAKGPVAVMTVYKNGPATMGPSLAKWFVYLLVVSVFVAYVTGRALTAGAPYLTVFRFAGTTAFIAYAAALWQDSIWYQRSLGTTLRYTVDGLIYGLLTASTFGWLWPR